MATKANPGKFDCYAKADPDEPLFTLRGKDPVAEYFVAAWVAIRAGDLPSAQRMMDHALEALKKSGRPLLPYQSEKSAEAQVCASEMRSWQKNLQMDAIEKRLNSTAKGN